METAWAELMHPAAARGEKVRDALSVMRKLQEIFRDAAEAAPEAFVCRKALLALLASERATVDFARLIRPQLEELRCDQRGSLKTFDETWSPADISNFMFGRLDWAWFVSMCACHWRSAASAKDDEGNASGAHHLWKVRAGRS